MRCYRLSFAGVSVWSGSVMQDGVWLRSIHPYDLCAAMAYTNLTRAL